MKTAMMEKNSLKLEGSLEVEVDLDVNYIYTLLTFDIN